MTEPVQGTADNPTADTGTADVDTSADAAPVADAVQQPEPPAEGTDTADADSPKAKTYTESYVKRMRNIEAQQRQKLKEAEDKHNALLDSIAKAVGVKSADQVDPAALAQQLEAARAETRQLKVEKALGDAASGKADVGLLTAVLAHQGRLADLDPAAATFTQDVEALVTEAIENNPRLKSEATAPAPVGPQRSGGDFSAGSGAGQPITEAQLAAMTPEQIAQAHADGKLAHFL